MRLHNRRSRSERGAIVPMVALFLVVIVPMSGMAVDLGMQRVVRRDMQAVADVVALDLVRLVDGRTASEISSGSNGQKALAVATSQSVARNSEVLGDPPTVTVKLAHIDMATGALDRDPSGVTRPVGPLDTPNAIEVTASGGVDFAFTPGKGGASRTAVAVPSPSACFQLGSYAAGVSTSQAALLNSLLPGLLNTTSLTTTAVGYQGLADAKVSVLDLVSVPGLGVGTPQELLQLDGLTVGKFYAALATVLQNRGGPTATVNLLQSLSTRANLTAPIKIADLLDIATAGSAALAAKFDVLGLVTGAAYLANSSNTLLLPALGLQLPALGTGASVSLKVGEAPRAACGAAGKATAHTGQVDLSVNGSIADVNLPLLLASARVQTSVSSRILLASARGTLTKIVCSTTPTTTAPEGVDVRVQSGLASELSLRADIHIRATLNLVVGVVSVDVTVPASATTRGGTSASDVSFRTPPGSYAGGVSTGSSVLLPAVSATVPAGLTVTIKPLVGRAYEADLLSVAGLGEAVSGLVSGVVGTLNTGLVAQLNALTPALATQLGVTVGGATVFPVPRPTCSDPALAG